MAGRGGPEIAVRKKAFFLFLGFLLSLVSETSSGGRFYDEFWVRHVVDGDTIELSNGEKVRYIGMDAPEERRRGGREWVFDPEPYAAEATQANRNLVQGKKVRLEFDRERRDSYGRLLAYVYVRRDPRKGPPSDREVFLESGEIFVNATLVQKGLARPLSIPPNTRHAERLKGLAVRAQKERVGLWNEEGRGHFHARER